MFRRAVIGDNERALVARKRRFVEVLEPGTHWRFGFGLEIEPHAIRSPELVSEWAGFLTTQRREVAERPEVHRSQRIAGEGTDARNDYARQRTDRAQAGGVLTA